MLKFEIKKYQLNIKVYNFKHFNLNFKKFKFPQNMPP